MTTLGEKSDSNNQLYNLTWGDFSSSLATSVQLFRTQGHLVDVTLSTGGRTFPAHKIVLSAASPFLLELLKNASCNHPILVIPGVTPKDMEALLEFIYHGEVSVDPDQLPSFLQAAQCLNIQGLAPGALHPDIKFEDQQNYLAKDAISMLFATKTKKKSKRKTTSSESPAGQSSKKRKTGDSENAATPSNMPQSCSGESSSEDFLNASGSKIRGASDQPTSCPFCGATLRQARNLRRHLEMLHFGVGKVPSALELSGESHSNSPAPLSSDSSSTLVVLPSSLCQPVMEAAEPPPPLPLGSLASLGPNVNSCLQPPSTVASNYFSYTHPESLLGAHHSHQSAEHHASAFRGVGIIPRPDPGNHSEV